LKGTELSSQSTTQPVATSIQIPNNVQVPPLQHNGVFDTVKYPSQSCYRGALTAREYIGKSYSYQRRNLLKKDTSQEHDCKSKTYYESSEVALQQSSNSSNSALSLDSSQVVSHFQLSCPTHVSTSQFQHASSRNSSVPLIKGKPYWVNLLRKGASAGFQSGAADSSPSTFSQTHSSNSFNETSDATSSADISNRNEDEPLSLDMQLQQYMHNMQRHVHTLTADEAISVQNVEQLAEKWTPRNAKSNFNSLQMFVENGVYFRPRTNRPVDWKQQSMKKRVIGRNDQLDYATMMSVHRQTYDHQYMHDSAKPYLQILQHKYANCQDQIYDRRKQHLIDTHRILGDHKSNFSVEEQIAVDMYRLESMNLAQMESVYTAAIAAEKEGKQSQLELELSSKSNTVGIQSDDLGTTNVNGAGAGVGVGANVKDGAEVVDTVVRPIHQSVSTNERLDLNNIRLDQTVRFLQNQPEIPPLPLHLARLNTAKIPAQSPFMSSLHRPNSHNIKGYVEPNNLSLSMNWPRQGFDFLPPYSPRSLASTAASCCFDHENMVANTAIEALKNQKEFMRRLNAKKHIPVQNNPLPLPDTLSLKDHERFATTLLQARPQAL
jgi:hypothetical protein